MRPSILYFLLCAMLPLSGAAEAAQRVETRRAARIVSTTPSITEVLYALGLGDRVVGVTRFCRYPPEAQTKPKIGDYTNPNLEAIATLRPDLVVIQNNPVRLRERLNVLHLQALEVNQQSLDAIYQSIRSIARATDTNQQATALIASMQSKLADIGARSAGMPRTRVMFVVGRAPGRLDGLIVAGNASYLNQILSLAGGANVFADAVASYPQVSLEEVIARNPEVIIDIGDMGDANSATPERKRSVVALWQRAYTVKAVHNRRVYPVAADIFVVPGPRAVNAAEQVFALLHPEAARGRK